ncbi:MAG: VOC family protein [Caulobacterales bacterium]|jgi:catechol 2,3-dioxygenase-like lactoylglutathione lyase family enzyme|nr:VOC family protein [Caulobacterales bacterium]MCC6788979.1 VOC family protein [Hyphomonadaceae bacterium]
MEPRVSLITLGVVDLRRSLVFYEAMGFRASSLGGGEVFFLQAGAIGLVIWSRADLASDAGAPEAGSGFRGIAIAHNVREEREVDEVLAAAEAAGGKITKQAHQAPWGGRTGYFADPDGHLWEVAWNPHFPLDEKGALTLPP